MKPKTKSDHPESAFADGFPVKYTGIKPGGFLERLLVSVATSRKMRWNCYYRACKRIPKTSPVHGTTSWKRINDRRGQLIDQELRAEHQVGKFKRSEELQALQDVCGTIFTHGTIVQNFLLSRMLRRLKKIRGETISDSPASPVNQ